MNDHREIKEDIIAILRDKALAGSGREISPKAPLGEGGLGLDSFAFAQFLVAVEARFDVAIPESFWIGRGKVMLDDLIAFISEEISDTTTAPKSDRPATPAAVQPNRLMKFLRNCGRIVYNHNRLYILQFDLENSRIPESNALPGLEMRAGNKDDLTAVLPVWPERQRKRKSHSYIKRLENGIECYLAVLDDKPVAIDWIATEKDFDPFTGIQYTMRPGSCLGFDLNEHPDYKGQGIGFATLLFSLRRTRERGYLKQFTIVHENNEKMLYASVQLLGFKKVGEISIKRILRRPFATWELGGSRGTGREIEL